MIRDGQKKGGEVDRDEKGWIEGMGWMRRGCWGTGYEVKVRLELGLTGRFDWRFDWGYVCTWESTAWWLLGRQAAMAVAISEVGKG